MVQFSFRSRALRLRDRAVAVLFPPAQNRASRPPTPTAAPVNMRMLPAAEILHSFPKNWNARACPAV
jgi:hypothetical protein